MAVPTWKEIKDRVESLGVTDSSRIQFIDVHTWDVEEIEVAKWAGPEDGGEAEPEYMITA